MPLSPPFLSLFDPDTSQEGTVDPLSLQAVAARLAERIFPWVTSRMSRIRFLTAICVGTVVCEPFEDELADDGVTPPWLVFEWYLVEAFIRRAEFLEGDPEWGRGVPGFRKVKVAVERGQSLSPGTYLKAPKVAGFSGVYKRLGEGLHLVDDDLLLGPEGGALVRAWQADQGLQRFFDGSDSTGLCGEIQKAVRDGLRKGHTDRRQSWDGWEALARHLAPGSVGKRERERIFGLLDGMDGRPGSNDSEALEMRHEMISALIKGGTVIERGQEANFFRKVRARASDSLAARLGAIKAYEAVSGLLLDAFNLIRFLSFAAGDAAVSAPAFAADLEALAITSEIPAALEDMEQAFAHLGCSEQVEPLGKRYAAVLTPEDLFHAVTEHHREAQAAKPPDGKRPWFESVRDGLVVRSSYRLSERPERTGAFVHDYRSRSVSTFLRDLRRLQL